MGRNAVLYENDEFNAKLLEKNLQEKNVTYTLGKT